jgi:hypothetical protein
MERMFALFGNEFGVYLNPFLCLLSLSSPPSSIMSFSVDDLVSSLSESHISQEANDISVLQVSHISPQSLACSLT